MDGGLFLREITNQTDEDAAAGAPGDPLAPQGPRIAITIAGPAGDHQTFTIPRSLVAGRQMNLGEMLRLAMDHDGDGSDDDPAAIARRRTFINQVRGWLPQADNVRYSMMLRRGSSDQAEFVDAGTPARISDHEDQDQVLHISFAQVYAGGGGE